MAFECADYAGGDGLSAGLMAATGLSLDGLGGQEDELEDVHNGRLDPSTDDEGRGRLDEPNRGGAGLEGEDEEDSLVEEIERRGVPDPRGEGGPSDFDRSMGELARKAGVKLPS